MTTARIESKSLQLRKERFNLNQAVQEVLDDLEIHVQDNYNIGRNNLQLLYESGDHDGGTNNNNRNEGRPDHNIIVNADRHMILQVISNLVNNAINFTRSGTISVEVEKRIATNSSYNNNIDYNDDDYNNASTKNYDNLEAIVKIKDTGSGIDEEILPRLFSKFATKSDHKGTGLGLFISKSIVEAHGGRIWAENNKDGRGATFAFSIPIDYQNN